MSLPWVERYVITTCQTVFCNFRYKLKKHFEKFSTIEEALENKHEGVKTQQEWEFLCTHFSSEKFKVRYSFLFLLQLFNVATLFCYMSFSFHLHLSNCLICLNNFRFAQRRMLLIGHSWNITTKPGQNHLCLTKSKL